MEKETILNVISPVAQIKDSPAKGKILTFLLETISTFRRVASANVAETLYFRGK